MSISAEEEKQQAREMISYVFASHGVTVAMELDAVVVEPVRTLLPPGAFGQGEPETEPNRHYRIEWWSGNSPGMDEDTFRMLVDGEERLKALSADSVANRLESDLQMFIAEFARPHLFLHAGVVQWHDRIIVLPGSSYAGKSTLVRALVQEGATYFSDEFAVLDVDGRILPYARLLSHREGPLGPTDRIDLQAHAPVVDDSFEPPRVDVVALMKYEADSAWNATELTGGAAVVAMSEHMVPIRLRPADTLQMLVNVAEHARVFRCVRPNLDIAIDWLREQVTTNPDPE